MKCPVCQYDMVASRSEWLCPNCGHVESQAAKTADTKPKTPAPVPGAPLPAAPPIRQAAGAGLVMPEPDAPAVPKSPDPPKPPVSKPLDSLGRQEPPLTPRPSARPVMPPPRPSAIAPDVKAESAAKPVASVATPPAEDKVWEHAASTLSSRPKPPSPPVRSSDSWLRAVMLVLLAAASAYSIYVFWQADPLNWFGTKPAASLTPSPSVTATPAATVSASPSPSPSPTASSSPSSTAASRDSQRKDDLAAYAAAYSQTKYGGGYFYTDPPPVNVHRNDPSTGQEYKIQTADPGALGLIQYQVGGRCNAPDVTPGAEGTRYLALQMKLESQDSLYCLDVQ